MRSKQTVSSRRVEAVSVDFQLVSALQIQTPKLFIPQHATSVDCNCNLFILYLSCEFSFAVSDFTETLAQLYEKHAEELQVLVSNYRKKNGELRKEVK